MWSAPACFTLTDDMDEQTSTQVCGLIAGILSSDQDVDVHEAGFIQRMRKRLGIKKGSPVPLVTDPEEAVAKLRGFSDEVQRETLELLIQAAAVDGKIAPEERSYLGVIAAKLGVEPADLDRQLQQQVAAARPQPFGPAASTDDD